MATLPPQNQFGIAVPALQKSAKSLPAMPFTTGDATTNSRKITAIKPNNWNQVFPYGFALYECNSDGSVAKLASSSLLSAFNGVNRISLNLPPSAFRWSTPFAVALTATAGGVLEESNGVVFRQLTIAGTTGLMPTRPASGSTYSSTLVNAAANLFPSSTTAIANVINQASAVASSITGPSAQSAMPAFDPSNDANILAESGYVSFWLLSNFLHAYSENKKRVEFQNVRLVFEDPKDNIGYVVSAISFDGGRDAANPYLYNYSIQLTAWDVVDLSGIIQPLQSPSIPSPSNPGAIKSALNVLRNTRNTVLAAQNVLRAVNADVNDIMTVYQKRYLSVKALVNFPADISDYAPAVIASSQELFKGDFANSLTSVWNDQLQSGNPTAAQVLNNLPQSSQNTLYSSTPASTTPQGQTINLPLSGNQTAATTQGLQLALNEALSDPTIAENIKITDFTLPSSLSQSVNTLNLAAQQTSANDIRNLIEKMQALSDSLAFATNSMDSTYESVFGLVPSATNTRTLTEDDVILQASIQEGIFNYESLLATGELYEEVEPDPFVIANQNLDPTAQLPSPLSAYPAIVDKDASIDKLAQKYLGAANRATEIVLLNGLRAPYIDEDGFNISMSGIGPRSCIVSDATNLAIGQKVTIYGTGVASQKRNIVNIESFGPAIYQITFDGDSSLDESFPQSVSPYFNARLPGCVGSNDVILIPTQTPLNQQQERPTYLQSVLNHAEKVFKVDLALGPDGDLMKDGNGDFALSYGYNNAVQAIRIKVETGKGELPQDPDFGLPFKVGDPNSQLPGQQVSALVQQAVTTDPRFFNANVDTQITGSAARVSVNAVGASGTQLVPVQFQIGKD